VKRNITPDPKIGLAAIKRIESTCSNTKTDILNSNAKDRPNYDLDDNAAAIMMINRQT